MFTMIKLLKTLFIIEYNIVIYIVLFMPRLIYNILKELIKCYIG